MILIAHQLLIEELQEHSESTETKNDSQTQIPLPSLVKGK